MFAFLNANYQIFFNKFNKKNASYCILSSSPTFSLAPLSSFSSPCFPLPFFFSPASPSVTLLLLPYPPLGLAAQTVAENTWADNSWADIAKPRNSWAAFGVGPWPTWADSNPVTWSGVGSRVEWKTSDRDARDEKVPALRASLPCRVESSLCLFWSPRR